MIRVKNINVFNFMGAIYGLRNPKESWGRIDSYENNGEVYLGNNDLELMQRLFKAGKDHRKFTRQLLVSMDITAPLYWWKEFDTYKVGTTANSTSTMHKIMSKPFTKEMFSFDLGLENFGVKLNNIVNDCNDLRTRYLNETDPKQKEIIWRALIQILPNAFMQTRHLTLNYEVLYNMYYSRKTHKLIEWREFCLIIKNELPYFKKIADMEE